MSRWNENKISVKNKNAIDKYIEQLIANGNSNKDTIVSYRSNIKKVLFLINKDYNKITKDDLNKAFSEIKSPITRELAKMKFRCFLRHYKLIKLADHIVINSKVFKEPTKTEDDILTEKEIEKLRNAPISIRDKAMIELFLTTGIRRSELIYLKLENIIIKKDEIIVKVNKSKTKKRNISIIPYPDNPIAFYPTNLIAYIENHQFRDDTSKSLFFSLSGRTYGKQMNPSSLTLLFKTIQKKAELQKKLTPHILRHTAATADGYHFTTGELELKYGWSRGSQTAILYCHLSELRMNEHIKTKAGLTPEIIEKESKCPYCETTNNINAKRCINCKNIIDKAEIIKHSKEQEKREQNLTNRLNTLEEENKKLRPKIELLNDLLEEETITSIIFIKNLIKRIPKKELEKLGAKDFLKDIGVTKNDLDFYENNKDKIKILNEK